MKNQTSDGATFYVEWQTLTEFGRSNFGSVAGRWDNRTDAMARAMEYAESVAERDGSAVAVVADEYHGDMVQVGTYSDDGRITLVYVWSIGPVVRSAPAGRGYVKCSVASL